MDIVERLNGLIGQGHYHEPEFEQAKAEIERLRERVKELATAIEFEANYAGHKALARSALQQKDNE